MREAGVNTLDKRLTKALHDLLTDIANTILTKCVNRSKKFDDATARTDDMFEEMFEELIEEMVEEMVEGMFEEMLEGMEKSYETEY